MLFCLYRSLKNQSKFENVRIYWTYLMHQFTLACWLSLIPVSRYEFTDELSLWIGQRTICLALKTAWQIIVNQSGNGYGWDNYTDYYYKLSIAIHSINCFEMRDTSEKLTLNCRVTAALCHSALARSETDDWPAHTRIRCRLNSWHRNESQTVIYIGYLLAETQQNNMPNQRNHI